MLEKIRALLAKYREQAAYLVVGCMTTVINYVIFAILTAAGVHYIAGNVAAWVVAVAFAYFANGRWVYRSTSRRGVGEAASFVASRLFSLGLEMAIMWFFVDTMHFNHLIVKLAANVVVVIVNYVLSKFIIFRKKD